LEKPDRFHAIGPNAAGKRYGQFFLVLQGSSFFAHEKRGDCSILSRFPFTAGVDGPNAFVTADETFDYRVIVEPRRQGSPNFSRNRAT
jgi:hypothetical protein